jgi:NitT/TauT family transport system ATP-binding protein
MAETALPILEMKNVGKIYSQNGRSIEALRGANLSVRKGEFICLIGASGCGKSTLLSAWPRVLRPQPMAII